MGATLTATHSHRSGVTRTKKAIACLLAVVCAFALSACVKLNSDMKISKDLMISGSILFQVDSTAFQGQLGGSPDIQDEIQELQSKLPPEVTVKEVSDDVYKGYELTFTKMKPEDFTAFCEEHFSGVMGRDLVIEKTDNGTIKFSMTNPLTADLGGAFGSGNPFSNPYLGTGGSASAKGVVDESIIKFTFPGKVISADGADVQGKTAVWNLKTFDGDTLTAEAKASGFPWLVLIIVAVVLVILLIIGGVILLVVMSKKKKAAQSQQPGFPGGFPPAGGQPGGYPAGGQPGGYPASGGQFGTQPGGYPAGDQFGSQPGSQPGGYGSAPYGGTGYGSAPSGGTGYGSAPQPGYPQQGNQGYQGNSGNSDQRFQPPPPGAY